MFVISRERACSTMMPLLVETGDGRLFSLRLRLYRLGISSGTDNALRFSLGLEMVVDLCWAP